MEKTKYIKLLTLILIGFSLNACGDAVPPPEEELIAQTSDVMCDSFSYKGFNPTNLNDEQKLIFIHAVRLWGFADVKWNKKSKNFVKIATAQDIENGSLNVPAQATSWLQTTESACPKKYTEIYINSNVTYANDFLRVSLHELGHHFRWTSSLEMTFENIGHLTNGNIMSPNLNQMSATLTAQDFDYIEGL